jgi:hypothetical protein
VVWKSQHACTEQPPTAAAQGLALLARARDTEVGRRRKRRYHPDRFFETARQKGE